VFNTNNTRHFGQRKFESNRFGFPPQFFNCFVYVAHGDWSWPG